MTEFDGSDFDAAVGGDTVLVDFYAPWCAPCRAISPHLEALTRENQAVAVLKVNIDDYPELADRLGVRAVPTLIMYRAGEEISRRVGAISKLKLEEFVAGKN